MATKKPPIMSECAFSIIKRNNYKAVFLTRDDS
jgi:hypothetical protein